MTETPEDRRRSWNLTIRLAVVALALALLVAFIAQNFVIVEVRLIAQDVEMRLAWALVIAALVGAVAGLLAPRPWR